MAGTDKLLQQVDGKPLLARVTSRALASGANVYVAVPSAEHPRMAQLKDTQARIVIVADAQYGMGHSIAALVAAMTRLAAGYDRAMILPADMPDIDMADLHIMLRAAEQAPPQIILRGASADGILGHPVVFPARYFSALGQLTGDHGGKDILRQHADKIQPVALPGQHALTDLDTAEDWAAWRHRQDGKDKKAR